MRPDQILEKNKRIKKAISFLNKGHILTKEKFEKLIKNKISNNVWLAYRRYIINKNNNVVCVTEHERKNKPQGYKTMSKIKRIYLRHKDGWIL